MEREETGKHFTTFNENLGLLPLFQKVRELANIMNPTETTTSTTSISSARSTYRYRIKSDRINSKVPASLAYAAIFGLFLFLIIIAHISTLNAMAKSTNNSNATVTNNTLV